MTVLPASIQISPPMLKRKALLIGLGVHDLVGYGLRQLAQQLLRVDRAVLEPREQPGRHLRPQGFPWYASHCGHRPFHESDLL